MAVRVLVTGATGFVGLHLVRHLVAAGAQVIGVSQDDPDFHAQQFLGGVPAGAAFVRGDVRDRDFLVAISRREHVDRFVHAAAVTPSPDVERASPASVIDVNLSGTVNVLEAARRCRARRLVLLSSSGLYGPPDRADLVITEDAPLRVAGLYSICKLAGEHIGRRYATLYGLSVIAARVGTVYGPVERPMPSRSGMSEVYTLMRAALENRRVSVFGADVRRDFCYAEDVGEMLARLTLADALTWDVYNVGSGDAHTVRDVATDVARLIPGFVWQPVEDPVGADLVVLPAKARGALDCARAIRDLDYRPRYPLASGLASYAAWLRARALHDGTCSGRPVAADR
jgi:UDP-glucose 4-epimerase